MLGISYTPGKVLGFFIFSICLALLMLRFLSYPRLLLAGTGRFIIEEETLLSTIGYKTIVTDHFVVKYTGDDATAHMVAATAEEARDKVERYFGIESKAKTPLVIYPDTVSMARSMGWDRDQKAMGVYFAGTIRVLDPSNWIEGEDPERDFVANGPMVHEYVHLVIDQMTAGNYPRWFTEGMAQYVEREINGFMFSVPEAAHENPYTLNELEHDFDNLDQAKAYWQSLTAVEYIIDKYGDDAPLKIMKMLGKGYTMHQALDALGTDYDRFAVELYQMWKQH